MTKKIVFCICCMLVSLRVMAAAVLPIKIDNIYYQFNETNKTAMVINVLVNETYVYSYSGDVVIPATVVYNNKTYTVTSIGGNAFYGCKDLTSVSIPNSVTTIGASAFNDCTKLSSIELPTTVKYIASKAFNGCRSLTSIDIPSSLTTIYEATFQGCSGLTSLIIPNSVTKIEDRAFCNCNGLTSVSIPESVTTIGKDVFYDCTSLPVFNHIRYADSYLVKVVDSKLTSYFVKEGTKWIGNEAFASCYYMKTIILPSSLKYIESKAFNNSVPKMVICYATIPPTTSIDCVSSDKLHSDGTLYVPAASLNLYDRCTLYGGWGCLFNNILPIMAEQVSVTKVDVIPQNDGVTIMWPMEANESLFTIEIKHGDDIIWTFTFNREGYLLSLNFEESTSVGNRQMVNTLMTSNGLQYTIMGLEENTEYTYTITIRDASIQPIKTYNGSFKTTDPTGLENLTIDRKAGNKFLFGNQLFIRRSDKIYNAAGMLIK